MFVLGVAGLCLFPGDTLGMSDWDDLDEDDVALLVEAVDKASNAGISNSQATLVLIDSANLVQKVFEFNVTAFV